MARQLLPPPTLPAPSAPTPRASAVGDMVIASGQIPVDPATGDIPAGIAAQTEQSCKNVGAIMEAAGSPWRTW